MKKTIELRRLGKDGPLVSAIGLGGAVFSPGYFEPVDDAQSIQVIRFALDHGINLIDTSDIYGLGHNEELIGRAIAGRRNEVVLASKFGWVVDGSSGTEVQTYYDLPGIRANGRPEYVHGCIDASLKRLGVDHLDIYYQHFPDPGTPVEETVGAMAELVRQGKVRHLGLCNTDAARLRRAQTVHPIAVVENEYSIWARNAEKDLLPLARDTGVGFVPWAPLGSGFLAGAVDPVPQGDFRNVQPRFKGDMLRENKNRFMPLHDVAKQLEITPAQLALAWLLHRGGHVVPIPGMTQCWQVEENLAAVGISLSPEVMARIDDLAPPGFAVGPELF